MSESFPIALKHRLGLSDRSSIFLFVSLVVSFAVFSFTLLVALVSSHFRETGLISQPDYCVPNDNPYRLSGSVTPLHYNLNLNKVQLDPKWRFSGQVDIVVQSEWDTQCLDLHAEDLDIQEILLYPIEKFDGSIPQEMDRSYAPKSYDIDAEHGFKLHVHFDHVMRKGSYHVLSIKYEANVRKDLRGFYKSSYVDQKNGDTHYMGVTQMESVDARSALPCFDEPAFKATFDVKIALHASESIQDVSDFKILSNGKIKSSEVSDDNTVKTVQFKRSPKMSTYLLAWVVGELDYIHGQVPVEDNNVPVRVYSPVGESEKGEYALRVAKKVIQQLVAYFGVTDSIREKVDLVAIPDFQAGAMENWGLITFRSARLLLQEDASIGEQEDVALVVAHELSHQQTGNLWTTEWWGSLFLNEGFANFFEHRLVELAFPAFKPFDIFLPVVTQTALRADSLPTSHPLSTSVNTSIEIDSMFSSITYDKGASILRMIQTYLGEDKFGLWLRNMAESHKYKSLSTNDFLEALNEVQDGVGDNMRQWIEQAGYPLVQVKKNDENVLYLTQSRFWSHEPIQGETERTKWWVPITYRKQDGAMGNFMTFDSYESETFDGPLLVLNVDRRSFYRVNYPVEHWQFLASHISNRMSQQDGALATMHLSTADRFGLADDVLALTRNGKVRIGVALDFLEAFKYEKELPVWESIVNQLMRIHTLVGVESAHEGFCRYARQLLNQIYRSLGWEEGDNEPMTKKRLRSIVVNAMIHFGDEHALDQAMQIYDNSSVSELPGNLKQSILEAVVIQRGELGFIDIETKLKNTLSDSDKRMYAYALVAAHRPSLIKRALEIIASSEIRGQDAPFIIRAASQNYFGTDIAWDFVRDNIESLKWKMGSRLLSNRLLPGVTAQFSSMARYKEVQRYLDTREDFSKISYDLILDTIRDNMNFMGYNYYDLKQYIKDNGFDQPPLGM